MYISLKNFKNNKFLFLQMLQTNLFQETHVDVNQQMLTVSQNLNNQRSAMYRKQKILIRDQNLKDNIMAVQRRIPRFISII